MKITDFIKISVGIPQLRILETKDENSKDYFYYTQTDLTDDLVGIETNNKEGKKVETGSKITLLKDGDVVFSLVSGMASIVRKEHDRYFYTQNYVVLEVNDKIDKRYLVYLLNQDKEIIRQLKRGLQGSIIHRYTVNQLRQIRLEKLPDIQKQKLIGRLYFKQLRMRALKERVAKNESILNLKRLKEVR